jgi:hypothetical protein
MTVTSATQTQYTQATNKTTATKATSAYETVAPSQTQQTDKMAEMKEKYKDVYTPIPETYSKSDEDLQKQKLYEAYPKYLTLDQVFAKQKSFYEGEPIVLGKTPTEEQEKQLKVASDKMNAWIVQEYGSQDGFTKMVQGGQEVINKYPVNNLAKEGVSNAKELARFQNAAIYEGLENGKIVEEAKKDAGAITELFMDKSYMRDKFLESIGQTGGTYEPEPIVFGPDHSLWDLRKYGIEGKWEDNKVYESDDAMIAELNKKISQFNFMLNNKGLMEEAENELAASSRGRLKSYQSEILNERLPKVQMALDIFKNYKIYDSIDVRG